jgi:hypothetical protein
MGLGIGNRTVRTVLSIIGSVSIIIIIISYRYTRTIMLLLSTIVSSRMTSSLLFLALLAALCSPFGSAWVPSGRRRHASSCAAQFLSASSSSTNVELSTKDIARVREVVSLARTLGPIGVSCSDEDQARILEAARSLKDLPGSSVVPNLEGLHRLVYSAAPGGSSGKIGPLVGTVTQEFVNATHFINAVALGPLLIELRASRKSVKDTTQINVFFHETVVTLFGIPLLNKPASGGGQWNCVWAGVIPADDNDLSSKKKLIRVMETPSLFVLEYDLVD